MLFSTGTIHYLFLLSDLIIHSATCRKEKWLSPALPLQGHKPMLHLTKTSTLQPPHFLPPAQVVRYAQRPGTIFLAQHLQERKDIAETWHHPCHHLP